MSQIREILASEESRNTMEETSIVRLYPDGSFYRAYEWSAWLCVRYISQFKATRRHFKGMDRDIVFIGFPFTSLDKFFSGVKSLHSPDDRNLIFQLPDGTFPHDSTPEGLAGAYQNWKSSVPISENKRKRPEGADSASSDRTDDNLPPSRMTDVMRRILSYPIERKSPLECMSFLAELKSDLSNLI